MRQKINFNEIENLALQNCLPSARMKTNCHEHRFEPQHDKTNKVSMRPAKTQISLGICPVWSESSLSAWRNLGSLATHWAHSEDSDQTGRMPRLIHSEDSDETGRMPRLIWVFTGRLVTLLILTCRGSDFSSSGWCRPVKVRFAVSWPLQNWVCWRSLLTISV